MWAAQTELFQFELLMVICAADAWLLIFVNCYADNEIVLQEFLGLGLAVRSQEISEQ